MSPLFVRGFWRFWTRRAGGRAPLVPPPLLPPCPPPAPPLLPPPPGEVEGRVENHEGTMTRRQARRKREAGVKRGGMGEKKCLDLSGFVGFGRVGRIPRRGKRERAGWARLLGRGEHGRDGRATTGGG